MQCDEACVTCFGAGSNKCNTCATTSNGTNYYLSYATTECVATCLPGQYQNISNHKCQVCDSNCKTCNILGTNCTTCYLNNGQYVFWENYVCVQKCADNWYGEMTTFICTACAGGCYTCTGPTLNECDTCTTFNSTIYYKDRSSRTCNTTCPSGQYIQSGVPYVCKACAVQCVACTVNNTNCDAATGCTEGYYYHAVTSQCLAICPNGYFPESASAIDQCTICADGCSLCYGPLYSTCTKCTVSTNSTPFYKTVYGDNCVTDCPTGYFEIAASLQCAACHQSCVRCNTSSLDCQQCQNASGVPYYLYNNSCLVNCPVGNWGYLADNTCQPCLGQCPSCFSNSTSACYSCTTYNATNWFLEYATTNCLVECPYGQY